MEHDTDFIEYFFAFLEILLIGFNHLEHSALEHSLAGQTHKDDAAKQDLVKHPDVLVFFEKQAEQDCFEETNEDRRATLLVECLDVDNQLCLFLLSLALLQLCEKVLVKGVDSIDAVSLDVEDRIAESFFQ